MRCDFLNFSDSHVLLVQVQYVNGVLLLNSTQLSVSLDPSPGQPERGPTDVRMSAVLHQRRNHKVTQRNTVGRSCPIDTDLGSLFHFFHQWLRCLGGEADPRINFTPEPEEHWSFTVECCVEATAKHSSLTSNFSSSPPPPLCLAWKVACHLPLVASVFDLSRIKSLTSGSPFPHSSLPIKY